MLKAQDRPWSQRMAATAMKMWKDSLPGGKWSYDQGVVLRGIEEVWRQTTDVDYFNYIKHNLDRYVKDDGSINSYMQEDFSLDNIQPGTSLLMLTRVLNSPKYYKATKLLRAQIAAQPRIAEGGFWHKKKYPDQMWLDGLYMAEPFYAEYAATFHEESDFDDIASQFILIEKHTRDRKTGLLYHAWDQSKKERWADPKTGLSANFWGRADGWYMMGLVDALEQFPDDQPKKKELIAILNRLAIAVQTCQAKSSGLWHQVLDKANQKDDYPEASASCMFVYALAKAVRLGYLPTKYLAAAEKGYQGIIKEFVKTDNDGGVNLTGTCGAVGLGGNPYRDGSYQYYTSQKQIVNEPKGVGSFILASVEIEKLAHLNAGSGKTALLDSYFNDERKADLTGKVIPFHYKWEEWDNNGFSTFGHVFNNYGFKTKTLYNAPDSANLHKASVYIIVDPDIPKENPKTKYILPQHIKAIADWVKNGGILVVLNNDTGNAEFVHLNQLMAKFGIHFNENSINHVTGRQFEQGAINIAPNNSLFKTANKVYLKEISTFSITAPAMAALVNEKSDIIVAIAHYGKGAVFAVGDPWFYNEYTDGIKLPAQYQNFNAANDVVRWVAEQIAVRKKK